VVPAANDAPIKLYEERLVGDKTRQKVGDVAVNKRIETEAASASIAIATERIIIERMAPKQDRIVDNMGFGEGKKIRLETYADIPRFQKEAFVREEVKIVKQVDLETATAEATVRHEELDIDVQSANGTKGI
jgi:phosphate transport system substrate-binding protein